MKWAFIYTLDDSASQTRTDVIGSLVCVGVPSAAAAPAVAQQLVADGVEFIELCGGFGGAGLGSVISAVENRVPVGAVFFGVDAAAGLNSIFPRADRKV